MHGRTPYLAGVCPVTGAGNALSITSFVGRKFIGFLS
jgi:hypothetical protein